MATGVVITVAEKLYGLLTSRDFKELCSTFTYESQLDELALTVSTIKAVLLDADLKQQELTHTGREYIERLKEAVYDVDDLFDEYNNTMVRKDNGNNNGKTFKKVRRFFSRSNQFLAAYTMSHEIKKIRDKLDNIAKNRQQFGFSEVFEQPKKRAETCSYVREDGIIGREADTEAIVGSLLRESDHHENVESVTIVGMGGFGKTALAQLVYNDGRIKDAFELRLWVCVPNEFGMEQIFAKMLGKTVWSGMEELLREVRSMIEGRRYLLVLDDVWEENRDKWVHLQDFLMLGGNGSRVLATSRSKAVSAAIGCKHIHVLQGLSDESSWRLFQRMAFEQGKPPLDNDLVDIGRQVVKKCANVPLSIRVVGSLLYGQHKNKWLSFESIDLRKLGSGEDGEANEVGIMPILKNCYRHLSPSLKSCFSYCGLFPKGFEISVTRLIWLWMAHGCLDVANDGRSIEDVGDDYFSILLNRCFFQDVKHGSYGEILYCKMHDLIHDLALEVGGKESLAMDTSTFQFDQKIRHLSIGNTGCKLLSSRGSCLGEMKKLRSLHHNFDHNLFSAANESNVNTICANLRRLRVLGLAFIDIKSLPNTLGNLSHLRYLDLALNHRLETLPESITKLQNLLVLNLTKSGVRELPKGLSKLRSLRHLCLTYCTKLTHMPVGIDRMVDLQTLSMFVVPGNTSKRVNAGQLKDLRSLVHLKGRLEIIFRSGFSYNLANAMEVDCLLSDKVQLNKLIIRWEDDASNEHDREAIYETLLEGLRPHSNMQGIEIKGYKGGKLPSWVGSLAVFFPWLVEVSLHGFDCLYNLPYLSQLLHLKVLQLSALPNVEFIECNEEGASSTSMSKATSDRSTFFPSLERLALRNLPKLRGVRNDVFTRKKPRRKPAVIQSFLRLIALEIEGCTCLKAAPRCPGLKTLTLIQVHEDFRFGSINDDSLISNSTFYLNNLNIDKIGHVDFLFGESLKGVDSLCINGFRQAMLSEATDLFQRHASSLRYLYLNDCSELKSLCGGGIQHLRNLKFLSIVGSFDLDLGEGDDPDTSPWKSLKNLGQLDLKSLFNMRHLPQGFQHLTSLRTLRICNCNLESLPEWLPNLTALSMLWLQTCTELKSLPEAISHMPALTELRVWNCKHLTDRCSETDGEDWPKIRDIHVLDIRPHIG